MPEVHLTRRDRELIASYQSRLWDTSPPRGIRRGTWANICRGEVCFVEWVVWCAVWATFPLALRYALDHSPSSVPRNVDHKARPNEVPYAWANRPPWTPWDPEDW